MTNGAQKTIFMVGLNQAFMNLTNNPLGVKE